MVKQAEEDGNKALKTTQSFKFNELLHWFNLKCLFLKLIKLKFTTFCGHVVQPLKSSLAGKIHNSFKTLLNLMDPKEKESLIREARNEKHDVEVASCFSNESRYQKEY